MHLSNVSFLSFFWKRSLNFCLRYLFHYGLVTFETWRFNIGHTQNWKQFYHLVLKWHIVSFLPFSCSSYLCDKICYRCATFCCWKDTTSSCIWPLFISFTQKNFNLWPFCFHNSKNGHLVVTIYDHVLILISIRTIQL